jgi:rhomboid protease GluP
VTTPSEPPRPVAVAPPSWLDAAPVTRAILTLNVAVFVVQVLLAGGAVAVVSIPVREELLFGANYPLATVGDARWETLVTACFLHGGVLHLGMNMLALWQAGPLVERAVGSARMAPMYLVAGVVGNLASTLLAVVRGQEMFGVGASGAISGVIAAALVVGWRVQGWKGPLTQAMVRWLAFVLIFGFVVKNVDNAAHAGGAVAGAAIAALWQRGHKYAPRATQAILAVCALVVVACIAIVGVRDRTDRFAAMMLPERIEYTQSAIEDGRCRDAHDGLLACERLRRPKPGTPLPPLVVPRPGATKAPKIDETDVVNALRLDVESACGRRL